METHTLTEVTRWLARSAPQPHTADAQWRAGEPATLAVGRHWDAVAVGYDLSRRAAARMAARGRHVGPRLISGAQRTTWWLLPLGTAYRLADLHGVTVQPTDAPLLAPAPGKYAGECTWDLPGDEDSQNPQWKRLTNADELRSAIVEARRTARAQSTGAHSDG